MPVRSLARHATALHARLLRATHGRVLGSFGGRPVAVLTTTGRRSGRPRATPVQVRAHGADLLVLAAAGGAPHPPAWWHNLQADPHAVVELGGRSREVVARTASGAERDVLWRAWVADDPAVARVAARAGRELPVVVLTPA